MSSIKFKDNNTELAKALVEHKKTIAELKIESSKYRCDYYKVYDENQRLKTQLSFAKNTVLGLFKVNTQNYTDVMRKLNITSIHQSSNSTLSSASQNPVPKQRYSLDIVKRLVIDPIIPKEFTTEVPAETKKPIGLHKQKPTTSIFQPASDKQLCGQSSAGLPQRELMDQYVAATIPSKRESNVIVQYGTNTKPHESNRLVPKINIASNSDGEDEELNISHTLNNVKRSPVGRKMNYDEEVNTSLRELKEKKLSEKLSPVQDENNRKSSLQTHHVAQAQLLDINKAKVPTNEFKSPTNNIRNNKVSSHSTKSSQISVQQETALEAIASQKVDPGEGTSGTRSRSSSLGDPSNVRINSTESSSPGNEEKYKNPVALLKRLQQQSQISRTPKKFFSSLKGNVTSSYTVSHRDLDKSPQFDVLNDQHYSHQKNNSISTPLSQSGHVERRKIMEIKPIKKSNQSVQQIKLNIETSIENKIKSIATDNLLSLPSRKLISNSEEAKGNEGILITKSITLRKSASRSPLKSIQSLNQSQVSNKPSESLVIVGNVSNGPKSLNRCADALNYRKSTHSQGIQSDDSHKRPGRTRTKYKENVSVDDEQPNGRASNSRDNERQKSNHSVEIQSNDSNKHQARSRIRSKENISIDDEQPNGRASNSRDNERQKSNHSVEIQSNDSNKHQASSRTKSKENISIDDEQPNDRASNSRDNERQKSNHSVEIQSNDSNKHRASSRTKSKENISIDDEQPNGRASNSCDNEHQKSNHSVEIQSNDSNKHQARSITRSKENVSIDDEQPNGRASNSRDTERQKSNHSVEIQSNDSNKHQARSKTRSKENVSIDDEQQSCAERPRRHIATTNYAEPKLNTKMRRNF